MRIVGVWIGIVCLFFLWQTLTYQGLIARVAEWQFIIFDRYWPTLTFVAVSALFSSPLIAMLWILRMRQRRDESLSPANVDDERHLLGRLSRLYGLFLGIALGSLAAALICLVLRWQLPTDQGTPRSIVIGSPDALGPVEGPAVITGYVDLGETAQFNENLLLVKRTLYFAPVRAAKDDRSPIRYFVQVRRNDRKTDYDPITFPDKPERVKVWRFRLDHLDFTPYTNGVLRHNGLPGEIGRLYRYAGHDLASDNYVLFSARATIGWSYYVLAAEFALSALISGAVAMMAYRRRRKVSHDVRKNNMLASAQT